MFVDLDILSLGQLRILIHLIIHFVQVKAHKTLE